MFKILKYDFIRKYKFIAIIVFSAIFLNLLLIAKFNIQGSFTFIGIFPFVLIVIYITDIIKMYSDELNKTTGYMLFMTSNSGYKIIISKVITAIFEGLLILLLYFIIIVVNSIYINSVQGYSFNIDLSEIIKSINLFLSGYFGFNLGHLFIILFTSLSFIISFILTVYTSNTIRKSIFSEIKLGGFLSFIIFIALNWATSYTSGKILSWIKPNFNFVITAKDFITSTELAMMLLPVIMISMVQSTLMIIISGYLLENKINL